MKTYKAVLESESPLIFSRMLSQVDPLTAKQSRETHEDYDLRIFREKAWADGTGQVIIPRVFFKRALEEAAQFLGLQIPGKGKSTYTKHFKAGVQVISNLPVGLQREELTHIVINCHADGKRGSGKRVVRSFPQVNEWRGEVAFFVIDEMVTKEVLRRHLEVAGTMIGIGSFRPLQGNDSGRFRLISLEEVQSAALAA